MVRSHRLEGNPLFRLGDRHYLADIVARKEPLGHDDQEIDGGGKKKAADNYREPGMDEDQLQASGRTARACLERSVRRPRRVARVVREWPMLEETAAQHRGQAEGDEAGNEHRHPYGDGELVEQPAEDSAHEKDRDEDRGKREGHGNNREADLSRSFPRCLRDALPELHVADDVLEHDDGIIDDEPHREGEGHQG